MTAIGASKLILPPLKLGSNRPRCHQLPKCEGRNGLMGLSLIGPLEGGALG